MNRKERKERKRQMKQERKFEKVVEGNSFKQWRSRRPFWGATLTILAGLMILYIPLHLYAIAFIPGSLVFVGFIFGGLVLIIGICEYFYPQLSTFFGIATIFLSVLSIMGALGGFLIGTILGIVAGALNIAWDKEEIDLDTWKRNKQQEKIEQVNQAV
ncbi:DUF6114 domain-containing protein [Ornithinibacillus halotolerans]|uniref:Uncharacterized protein n=1 Tax=Ornithinibacillus halotolerans TaxID=1274357 RepID=A0A916RRD1_9BACI|nr:DUF6114 domain-containing protein [Ornithinibacillus halotolerans]GGA66505.1 hypothetical protein GCM10008025_07930 [Ornithinibacillus halotolerans]